MEKVNRGEGLNNTQIALLSAVVGALIGFIGAIVSGYIGGKWSYKGAMDAITKEIMEERNMIEERRKENKILAKFFIDSFLKQEIEKNFKQVSSNERLMVHLSAGVKGGLKKEWSYKFCFDEYDKIKYDLVKFNSEIIEDIACIYKLFTILENKNSNYDLTEYERKFIPTALKKCKDLLQNVDYV